MIAALAVKKWAFDLLLGALLLTGSYHSDLLEYGLQMGVGQIKIVLTARPVRKFLVDPSVPDSLKKNVLLISDIKKFTVDSLGFFPSKNYSTVYDQKGKPMMWVVTACEKYALKPKMWKFPVAGKVSYKGFFNEKQAQWESAELEKQGYETKIRIVNAWSTLGWFRDPIMTSMLEDEAGEIANVIIHELSHGTIYVKNNSEYSENLANFIGDMGSYWYLRSRYGENSPEYREFFERNEDYRKFAQHFVNGAHRLDSLYSSANFSDLPSFQKDEAKKQLISDIVNGLDTIQFYSPHPMLRKFREGVLPNNAFFIVFLQYNNQQDQFMEEFQRVAGSDLRKYVAYLRKKFPG